MYDRARDLYEQCINIDNKCVAAYHALAFLRCEYYNMYDDARDLYKKCIIIDNTCVAAYHALAYLYDDHYAMYSEAIKVYKECIKINIKNIRAHRNLLDLLEEHYPNETDPIVNTYNSLLHLDHLETNNFILYLDQYITSTPGNELCLDYCIAYKVPTKNMQWSIRVVKKVLSR